MMWYGQINFTQKNDSLNRSALLMTLAMLDTDFDTLKIGRASCRERV